MSPGSCSSPLSSSRVKLRELSFRLCLEPQFKAEVLMLRPMFNPCLVSFQNSFDHIMQRMTLSVRIGSRSTLIPRRLPVILMHFVVSPRGYISNNLSLGKVATAENQRSVPGLNRFSTDLLHLIGKKKLMRCA